MRITARWLALSALLATLGCASDDASSFEYDEGAAAQYIEAFCSCSPTPKAREGCEALTLGRLVANSVAGARAGRLTVHAEHWEDCLDQIADCGRDSWPACEQLLEGQVAEGETCVFIDECAEGLYCTDPADTLECALGTCEPKHARGEPCDGDDACSNGDLCFELADGSRCQAPLEQGERCPIDFGVVDRCGEDLACVPDESGLPVCGTPLELGEPCGLTLPDGVTDVTINGGLYPNPCEPGAFCSGESRECVPNDQMTFSDEPRQALGEECDGEFGELLCPAGAVCVDEVCVERGRNGAECELDEQCWGACIDGECAPSFEPCEAE